MMTRRETLLAISMPTLLGVLAMTLLSQFYVEPFILGDTHAYIDAARWEPYMTGYRTPFYGWLLIAAKQMHAPIFAVVFQSLFWILCVTAFSLLVSTLTRSAWRTAAAGTVFVLIEIAVMYTPAAQWFLVSDPLYADWTTLGIFLMLIGKTCKRDVLLWSGAAFIGMSSLLRPVLVPVMLGILMLTEHTTVRRTILTRTFTVSIALLFAPVVVLSAMNLVMTGNPSLSPVTGLNMAFYTKALLRPDDVIFDDQSTDQAFHMALEQYKTVPEHVGRDSFYLPPLSWWSPVFQFYGSLTSASTDAQRRFDIAGISSRITLKLIEHHPLKYLRLFTDKWFRTMIPNSTERDAYFWQENPYVFQNHLQYSWSSPNGWQREMGDGFGDPHAADMRIGPWLNAERYGVRLPTGVGPRSAALVIIVTVLMLIESMRRLRSRDERMRLLGVALSICVANTFLSAAAYALVTLYDDPRYALPGIMTGTAAFLLTAISLSLRTFPSQRLLKSGAKKG